jgi:hypothetical protein
MFSYYFERGSLDQILTFRSGDNPGNIQIGCDVKPFGIHYFGDLTSVLCHSMQSSPYLDTTPTNYFPFSYIVLRPLIPVFELGIGVTSILFFTLPIFAIVSSIWKKYKTSYSSSTLILLITMILFSQPFLNLIDRGNIQLIVLAALFLALANSSSGPNFIAPFCLGVAIALKGYPIIYIVRFAQQKRWSELYVSLKTALLLTVISLLIFDGGLLFNINEMVRDINAYRDTKFTSLAYNNSLMALLQSLIELRIDFWKIGEFATNNYVLLILPMIIMILIILGTKNITDFDNAILCAVFCSLFIELSPSYVLTGFLLPLIFLDDLKSITPSISLTLFGIAGLMMPKNIPLTYVGDFANSASLNSLINPILMIMIFSTALWRLRKQSQWRAT